LKRKRRKENWLQLFLMGLLEIEMKKKKKKFTMEVRVLVV
jgi:hypothetical protein